MYSLIILEKFKTWITLFSFLIQSACIFMLRIKVIPYQTSYPEPIDFLLLEGLLGSFSV